MPRPFQFHLPPYDGSGGLTPEQRGAVECEGAIFTGVPGTGKTTVAIWRILKNKDDILLTYTRLLSAAIGHLVLTRGKTSDLNRIWGAHQWYWHHCDRAMLDVDIDNNTVLQTLRQNNVMLDRVVIDEGQDMDIVFLRAIKDRSKRISVGADDAQKLFDTNVSERQIIIFSICY